MAWRFACVVLAARAFRSPPRRRFAARAPRRRFAAHTHARTPTLRGAANGAIDDVDLCILPPSEEEVADSAKDLLASTRNFDLSLQSLPVVAPVLAFASYQQVAGFSRMTFEALSKTRNYESVDGGAYEIAILTPTINGIVVPALSIAFGTLTATTINTLRQRQLDARTQLNRELSDLQMLRVVLEIVFRDDRGGDDELRASLLARDYVSRIIAESASSRALETRSVGNNELVSLSALLLVAAPDAGLAHTNQAHAVVASLSACRATRLAVLSTAYPPIHFVVLGALASSIVVAFLLESDQEVLRFLDALQLRLLFTILIGVFAALAALVVDLADPFRGAYRITPTVAQLFPLREAFVADVCAQQDAADSDRADRAERAARRPGTQWY